MIGEFHFLRPLWLPALLPMLALAALWLRHPPAPDPWRGVIDAHLLRHLRAGGARTGRLAGVLLVIGWTVGVLALAGPTWSTLPAVKFRPDAAPLVVVFDLSRSMDATDVAPSRLTIARGAADVFLDRLPPREVGLVVFAGRGHAVMPLTEDRKVVRSLLPHLRTDLMPVQGSDPAKGLERAARLLRQSGGNAGEILLVTDGDAVGEAAATAERLHGTDIRISVLAVGTAGGGVIPTESGTALTHDGKAVTPQLDISNLGAVAKAGGGSFVWAKDSLVEITPLLPRRHVLGLGAAAQPEADEGERRTVWLDRGPWLVFLLLPLAAVAFRRGWLGGAILAIGLSAAIPPAHAFDWEDLWSNNDQKALNQLNAGDAATASRLFRDPFWRGVAQYRDHDYEGAVRTFGQLDSAEAHYNRGNALVRLNRLEQAVEAYTEALKRDPTLESAFENRRIVEKAMEPPPNPPAEPPPPPRSTENTPSGEKDESAPFAQEFLAEKGGDRMVGDIEGKTERHGLDGTLGSGQILSEGSEEARGKKGEGTGQASNRRGLASEDETAAKRSGDSAGGMTPGRQAAPDTDTDSLDSHTRPETDRRPPGMERDMPPETGGDASHAPSPATGDEAAPSKQAAGASQGRAMGSGPTGRTETPAAGSNPEETGRQDDSTTPPGTAPENGEVPAADGERQAAVPPPNTAPPTSEDRQAVAQWLMRVPDDPGGLLRELFRRDAERGGGTTTGQQPW